MVGLIVFKSKVEKKRNNRPTNHDHIIWCWTTFCISYNYTRRSTKA